MGGSDILGCGVTDGAIYLDIDLEISLNNFSVAQVILFHFSKIKTTLI